MIKIWRWLMWLIFLERRGGWSTVAVISRNLWDERWHPEWFWNGNGH